MLPIRNHRYRLFPSARCILGTRGCRHSSSPAAESLAVCGPRFFCSADSLARSVVPPIRARLVVSLWSVVSAAPRPRSLAAIRQCGLSSSASAQSSLFLGSVCVARRDICSSAVRRQSLSGHHHHQNDTTNADVARATADELDMAADAIPKEELHRLVATRVDVPVRAVRYVLEETKSGATVPFLARYRQDETGHMQEDVLRQVIDTAAEVKEVHRRRQFMLKSLSQRGLLTPKLQASLERMVHLSQLEDAWEPYKERKNTLAARGREAGLGQFADPLLHGLAPVAGLHETVKKVGDGERLMIAILSEELQRDEELRQRMLEFCRRTAQVRSSLITKARKKEAKEMRDGDFEALRKKFAFYDGRRMPLGRLEAHAVLALQRGEAKGVLKVDFETSSDGRSIFDGYVATHFNGAAARLGTSRNRSNTSTTTWSPYEVKLVREAANGAFEHLVKAALNTIHRDVRKSAEKASIHVFAHNLRQMLLQRPLSQSRLLAMDPGLRNGVKCVSLDANGNLTSCFKCTLMDEGKMQDMIVKAVRGKEVNKIVIGNGTASQETARVVSQTIQKCALDGVEFAVVSEAGASVYSASEMAKEEFPTLDIMFRGAVSIGRRVLDPLSELVKIPVRSMGIGMYQHDVNEKELLKELGRVLESCVATVGVNAASANRYVMEQVPGIQKKVVDQIVLARHSRALSSREDLRRVPGMTEPMFQQIAGFFRFPNSKEPLDATSIHPESYEVARKLMQLHDARRLPLAGSTHQTAAGTSAATGAEARRRAETGQALLDMSSSQLADLAAELGCGVETLRLVAQELCQPGLDPRASLPHAGLMRTSIKDKSELQPGEVLRGVVMSVVTFGTFVDCGLHDSVLLRGNGVDRLQIGSLVENMVFKGLDNLGRVQVEWDGVSGSGLLQEGLRQRLRLEMEDTLAHPPTQQDSASAASSKHSRPKAMKRSRSSSSERSAPSATTPSDLQPPRKRAAVEPAPAPKTAEEESQVDLAVAEIVKSFATSPAASHPAQTTAHTRDSDDEGAELESSSQTSTTSSERSVKASGVGSGATNKSKSKQVRKSPSTTGTLKRKPGRPPGKAKTQSGTKAPTKQAPRTAEPETEVFTF